MLAIITVFLLFLTAGVIVFIYWQRPHFPYIWLIAAGGALLSLFILAILRFYLPQSITLFSWNTSLPFRTSPSLTATPISWAYAVALGILNLAVILTSVGRPQLPNSPLSWAGSLVLTGFGFLAVFGADVLTIALVWSVIDLIGLGILISQIEENFPGQRLVIGFALQILGTFLVVWGGLAGQTPPADVQAVSFPSQSGLAIILGIGLRLGILPFYFPILRATTTSRGLGSIILLSPAASSLVLLSQAPFDAIPQNWSTILTILTVFTGLYGSYMWIKSPDEAYGRRFWLVTLSSMAMAISLNGHSQACAVWGLALILGGGMLFLYTLQTKWLAVFMYLELFLLTGLPFTPLASGWLTEISVQAILLNVWLVICLVSLCTGYLRHVIRYREPLELREQWIKAIYPAGIVIFPIAHLLLGLFGWPGLRTLGAWWMGVAMIAIFGALISQRRVLSRIWANPYSPDSGDEKPKSRLEAAMRLDWLVTILVQLYRFVNFLIRGFSTILEGEGGVLWTMVLLFLLLAIIQSRGGGI